MLGAQQQFAKETGHVHDRQVTRQEHAFVSCSTGNNTATAKLGRSHLYSPDLSLDNEAKASCGFGVQGGIGSEAFSCQGE